MSQILIGADQQLVLLLNNRTLPDRTKQNHINIGNPTICRYKRNLPCYFIQVLIRNDTCSNMITQSYCNPDMIWKRLLDKDYKKIEGGEF